MIDFAKVALAARRANVTYIEDDGQSRAAFEALGDHWIAQFQDDSKQATLSVDPAGATWLSISGTRASQGEMLDVWRDVQLEPVAIKGGTVTHGVCDGMDHLFDWALSVVPAGAVLNLTGHSLGSARVQIAPAYLPAVQIGDLYGFAAPKFIAADFFASYADVFARFTGCVNGTDGWASWPWIDERWKVRAPTQHIWLKDEAGAFELIDGNKWPGGMDFSDHDVSLYQSRLERIAAAPVKPAA